MTGHSSAAPQAIVLTGGRARRLWPLTLGWPKALLSVGGKPFVFHWLSAFIDMKITRVTVVVNPESRQVVEDVLCRSFDRAPIEVALVEQVTPYGPGDAFAACAATIDGPVLLVLGDTLCSPSFALDADWIGVAEFSSGTHGQWCVVEVDEDGFVQDLIDKPVAAPESNLAAIGIYYFSDCDLLRSALAAATDAGPAATGEIELSSILTAYRESRPIGTQLLSDWTDLGTLSAYAAAARERLPRRAFTGMAVSPSGVVVKGHESDVAALADEAAWFACIPQQAKILSPRVLAKDERSYSLELLDYPSVAELFTTGVVGHAEWAHVLAAIVGQVRDLLWSTPVSAAGLPDRARAMYCEKPIRRLEQWERGDLILCDELQVNGKTVPGVMELWRHAAPALEALVESSVEHAAVIHGDLSFANILLSPRYGLVRLLDPRGNFGGTGVIGDCRYEGAKLRQSYHGHYDVLVAGLYDLNEICPGEFEFSLYPSHLPDPALLDGVLTTMMPWSVDDLALIEATLFLSMIPMHTESASRQLAFFLSAVGCLDARACAGAS